MTEPWAASKRIGFINSYPNQTKNGSLYIYTIPLEVMQEMISTPVMGEAADRLLIQGNKSLFMNG